MPLIRSIESVTIDIGSRSRAQSTTCTRPCGSERILHHRRIKTWLVGTNTVLISYLWSPFSFNRLGARYPISFFAAAFHETGRK